MLEKFEELDRQLFIFLNGIHNSFFDAIMPWITYKYTWFPLYLVLIIVLIIRYRWNGFYMVLVLLASVGAADLLTSGFMKPYFARLRPCYEPDLSGVVHFILGCGGKYGFASAHASTTFALAMSIWLLLRKWSPLFGIAFLWSGLVAYSRIYLGVHYPSDIFVGALVGMLIAWCIFKIYCLVTTTIFGNPVTSEYLEPKQ